MVGYKEIPQSVLLQTNMLAVVEKFRNKVRAFTVVKDADLQFNSVKGARVEADRLLFDTLGKVSVSLVGIPSLVLAFSGAGEYRRKERRVYLTDLKILNDVAGFANKLVDATGIGVGRSLHVTDEDDELLLTLFPEASA